MSGQLIAAFQGQGATIGSFLTQTAALTNTLADRDQLIGQVVDNLNTVLGSLGDQSDQFAKAVDSLSATGATGWRPARQDISNAAGIRQRGRRQRSPTCSPGPPAAARRSSHETDRAAGIVLADHDYFDNFLNTLPDAYQALGRQGLYGDFFSFYLCDIVLKLNGKGRPAGLRQDGRPGLRKVHAAMKSFSERNPLVIGAVRSWR